MTLCIIGFARRTALQRCFCEGVDLEGTKEEVFSVEQEDEFVQPRDQERNYIVALHRNFPADRLAYLFWRDHQALHALSCMDEYLRKCAPESMYADIGGMSEHLIGSLPHYSLPRSTASRGPWRMLRLTCIAVPFLSSMG